MVLYARFLCVFKSVKNALAKICRMCIMKFMENLTLQFIQNQIRRESRRISFVRQETV